MISGSIGLRLVTFLPKIGFRVGYVPSISHECSGGRCVIGLLGTPEHNPGYFEEQDVPLGQAEHAGPILYISDLRKLPPIP